MRYERESARSRQGTCERRDGKMIAAFGCLGVGIAGWVSQEQLPIVESDMRWLQCGGWEVDGSGWKWMDVDECGWMWMDVVEVVEVG